MADESRSRRPREKPKRGDAREHDLLRAGEEMLAAGRFEDVSISALADAAGISRSTFYFYFASKDDLLARLVERALGKITDFIAAVAEDEATIADPVARVRQAVGFTAQAWLEHREVMRAAVELSGRLPEIDRIWTTMIESSVDILYVSRQSHDIPWLDGPVATRRLIRALAWASERNFYNWARSGAGRSELRQLERDLEVLWKRTLGLEG